MCARALSRKEEQERYKKEGRLPPGQSLTQKFPVLHYGPVPQFDPQTWELRVWGEVEQDVSWTWQKFNQLPRTELKIDLHCVTRWSKFDTRWEGVSPKLLVEEGYIKPKPTARFVVQHAEFGYTTNLPLEIFTGDNFLLATHYNGEALSPQHGYPLRGVVGYIPGRSDLPTPYLWKGAKWLRGIEFLSSDNPGFWERAGYHNDGDIWKEEREA